MRHLSHFLVPCHFNQLTEESTANRSSRPDDKEVGNCCQAHPHQLAEIQQGRPLGALQDTLQNTIFNCFCITRGNCKKYINVLTNVTKVAHVSSVFPILKLLDGSLTTWTCKAGRIFL